MHRHLLGEAAQDVDARRMHGAEALHDIAVERHMGHHAFLQEQMPARREAMPFAPRADCAEEVLGKEIADCLEVLIANLLACRTLVEVELNKPILGPVSMTLSDGRRNDLVPRDQSMFVLVAMEL